jgi:hypothetical protein
MRNEQDRVNDVGICLITPYMCVMCMPTFYALNSPLLDSLAASFTDRLQDYMLIRTK